MKKLFLLMSILGWFSVFFSCLDQEDSDFEPKVAAVNNSYFGKDGDSIPPENNDSTDRDTGGEEGQIPVKP
jgi:hypothetical protein